jgi:transcriptional regulator CtsR
MTEKELLENYMKQLNEKEKKAYEIARIQLESSFDITKSIGFLNYKKKMSNTNN